MRIDRIPFTTLAITGAAVALAASVSVADALCSAPAVCHVQPASAVVWAPGTSPAADAADAALYLSGIEYQ